MCARSKTNASDEAFSSAFGSLQARKSEEDEAAAATGRARAEERARACSTVWEAAKYGVPVRTLRELMDEKIESRYAWTHSSVRRATLSERTRTGKSRVMLGQLRF